MLSKTINPIRLQQVLIIISSIFVLENTELVHIPFARYFVSCLFFLIIIFLALTCLNVGLALLFITRINSLVAHNISSEVFSIIISLIQFAKSPQKIKSQKIGKIV